MLKAAIDSSRLQYVSIAAMLLSVACFAITRSYMVLAAPAAMLYMLFAIANWRAAYWLLILSIPLSIQFELGSTLSLSLPDEPMCWYLSFIFILLVAYNPRMLPRWWWKDPVLLIVLLQLFWLCVATACSTVFVLSVKFTLAKVWYLICFFVFPLFIFTDKKDFRQAFILFLLPMLATIVIILYRLAHHHYGFAAIGASVGSLYINHVEYAAVISIFYPLVWVAWPLSRHAKKWVRLLLLVLLLFFIPAIFFTYARVAILAIGFAAVVGIAVRYRLVNGIMPLFCCAVIIGFIYLLHDNKYIDLHPDYYHTTMHNDYNNHIISTFQGKDVSSMERLYRWVAAVRMSKDRPMVGYGPHGFVYNYKPYTVALFKTYVSNNREHTTTHNYFLYMLTEQGWPAMLLYTLLIAVVFAQAQKTYHRFTDRFYKYCTLGLVMAFASSFVNNLFSELIETHKAGAMFYLIIALLMILRHKSIEERKTAANKEIQVCN